LAEGSGTVQATNFAFVATAGTLGPEVFQFIGLLPASGGFLTANFNIWEDHVGGELSDKLTISVLGNVVVSTFLSDTEGVPLAPFTAAPGTVLGDLVETGTIQYVDWSSVGHPELSSVIAVGFKSEVPEPGSVLLLMTMLGLTGGVLGIAKLRRT